MGSIGDTNFEFPKGQQPEVGALSDKTRQEILDMFGKKFSKIGETLESPQELNFDSVFGKSKDVQVLADGTKVTGHMSESGKRIIDEIEYTDHTKRKFGHDDPNNPEKITSMTEPSGRKWVREDINGNYGPPLWTSGSGDDQRMQSGYVKQLDDKTIEFSYGQSLLDHEKKEQTDVTADRRDVIDFERMEAQEKKVDQLVEKYGKNLSPEQKEQLMRDLEAVLMGNTEALKDILKQSPEVRAALKEALESEGYTVRDFNVRGPGSSYKSGMDIIPPGGDKGLRVMESRFYTGFGPVPKESTLSVHPCDREHPVDDYFPR